MNNLLEKRNTIYGALAIWIVLFHTFRRISMLYIPVVTNIVGIGNMAVDVFFFFSGLCLSLSAVRHNYQNDGWRGYYHRRFARILIPYFIIGFPYYIWAAVYECSGGISRKILSFVANLTSASFWLRGTQTTWYVYGILVFYLLFPLLFSFVLKTDRWKKLVLLASMIIFAVIVSYIPVLNNSVVVWARLPIFTIGIMAGDSSKKVIRHSNKWTILAIIVLVVLGTTTSLSELSDDFTMPQVYRLLLYIPMVLSLAHILSLFNGKLTLLEMIGGLSLEIYLIHITLLHPLNYYGVLETLGYWLYLMLPVATLLIAYIVGKIESVINRNLGV